MSSRWSDAIGGGRMSADRKPVPAQRPRIGAVLCSLCGREIVKISDLAKETVAPGLAVLHRQCYDSLAPNRPKRTDR